jgi:hypothetical protein
MKTEEFKANGEDVVRMVKKLVKEGNVRRISIKNEEGKSVIELPLTIGVVGAVLLPTLAAVGAVAALLAKCTIMVEREEPVAEPSTGTPPEPSV